ncbi:unnamed protein product [Caenorhabditis sp. 36 PRJEB53466]|nr:unnamed protein product [Caenorhabditis sp. 36 PRJEB53466]
MAKRKEYQLYVAFLLTTLGDRMWMFAIGFFMTHLGAMAWVAVHQFIDAGSKLTFLFFFGKRLDKVNRSKIIQYSLFLNNVTIALSAAVFGYMFLTDMNSNFLLVVAAGFSSISRIASEIQRISFQKDWVIVIAGAEEVELSKINSMMTVLDQVSSVVFPIVTGALIDHIPWTYVCAIVVSYNIISWIFESSILRELYDTTAELQTRETDEEAIGELHAMQEVSYSSLKIYREQSSFLAGFGLSLLFLTVLGFDNLATSYGQSQGMSALSISILRAAGSLLGVFGAMTFPHIAKRVGLLWTIAFGLLWQNVFIQMCGVSVLLPGSPLNVAGFVENYTLAEWARTAYDKVVTPEIQNEPQVPFMDTSISLLIFFIGITGARFGLWIADPAITQIQQETIPEKQRYTVFTFQSVLYEGFSMIKDVAVIFLFDPSLFGLLVWASCFFVFLGFVLNEAYHVKCGFSCANKSMHLPRTNQIEMDKISAESAESKEPEAERQSLLADNLPEKAPVIEENRRESGKKHD